MSFYDKSILGLLAGMLVLGGATAFVVGMKQEAPADGVAVAVDTSAIGALQHPDAATLELWSEAAGVPVAFTYAMAWEETRNNPSPWVRGAHGEYGRFQIKLTTARSRCPGLDVRQYDDNLACFLRMSREDWQKCGWACAARIHNGSGRRAEEYASRVMETVRVIVNSKVGVV